MTNRAPLIAAIVLLLLPVLYVGSYFALVVPGGDFVTVPITDPAYHAYPFRERVVGVSFYRVGGNFARTCFWPLEQIDRKVRPEAWE